MHVPLDGYFGAITNNTAMNIGVQVSMWTSVFRSLKMRQKRAVVETK